jgi:glycosidase
MAVTFNADWEPLFRERLERHYEEMKWLYFELYHNDQQAFDYFLTMLHEYYTRRSEELREWDEARELNPDWYKGNDMLGMLMYTQCFAGNLKGVREHLDYIKECGINYVHLMPLLESPRDRSDGGYAVADFRKVQPELGTMEDLADLSKDCHSKGMSVCLDFVMNHTSEDHEWARRARAGEKEFQDRYFFFDDWNIPNQFEQTVPQVFPQTAPGNFSWCQEAGKVVMTTFYPYQWDLNYRNPTVFNDMTANMLNLCNHGVDIIRLDAVPYIWKTLGSTCRNLPQVHTLVRLMRMASEIVCPGTLLLGEVVMEPSKVVPYFGTLDKPECHMLYNVTTMASTWHTVATHDVRLLRHQLESIFSLPREYTFLNYLRCHDDIGWGLDYDFLKQFGIEEVPHKKYLNDYLTGKIYGVDARGELYNDDPRLGDARLTGTTASLCGIEASEYERNDWKLDRAIRLDLMLHAFLLTQSGIPVLYSGDEIGQLNDYSYHEDPLKWDDSRYLHRGNLKWEEVALRSDPTTRQGRIFQGLKKLENLRKSYAVFESDADTWVVETYNDHILGIGRYEDGEKLIALFNFSDQDETAWINEVEDYTDMLTGQPREARAVGIPAYDFVWLLTSFKKSRKDKELPKEEALETTVPETEKAEEGKRTEEKTGVKAKSGAKAAAKPKTAAKNTTRKKTVKSEAADQKSPEKAPEKQKTAAKAEAEAVSQVKPQTKPASVKEQETESEAVSGPKAVAKAKNDEAVEEAAKSKMEAAAKPKTPAKKKAPARKPASKKEAARKAEPKTNADQTAAAQAPVKPAVVKAEAEKATVKTERKKPAAGRTVTKKTEGKK